MFNFSFPLQLMGINLAMYHLNADLMYVGLVFIQVLDNNSMHRKNKSLLLLFPSFVYDHTKQRHTYTVFDFISFGYGNQTSKYVRGVTFTWLTEGETAHLLSGGERCDPLLFLFFCTKLQYWSDVERLRTESETRTRKLTS